ncbi:DUF11 domain-containing protein [Leucothrix sargassi]|nr:DUF11 domain-containing protein [Leucothrix sargassi]
MRITDCLGLKSLSFFILLFMAMSSPLSAKTSAGTVITNQAEISWFDSADGLVKTAYSNVSQVTVKKQYDLILVPDNVRHTRADRKVDLPHRLTNTGNTPSAYEVRIRHDVGDSDDLVDMRVFSDVNGNGLTDAGEPEWQTIECEPLEDNVSCYFVEEMDPNELTEFVITGYTPSNAQVGDEYRMNIRTFPDRYDEILSGAIFAGRNVTPEFTSAIRASALPSHWVNNDLVDIVEGAVLTISKSATPVCGVPVKAGDTITYTINFNNTGSAVPVSKVITIDGEEIAGAVLEDTLPANVTLSNALAPLAAPNLSITLVQLRDDEDTDRWIRFSSWNGTDVISKLGLYIPTEQMQPNQSGKLEFEVTVNQNVTRTSIYNQAEFDLVSGGEAEFVSNSVCSSIEPGNTRDEEGAQPDDSFDAEIRFLTPVLDIKRDITNNDGAPSFTSETDFEDADFYRLDSTLSDYDPIRDGVYIELNSSAVNTDEDTAEEIVVTVTSGTGDTLLVTLVETGPNTGIFRSLSPIRMSDTDTGDGASCPSGSSKVPNYTTANDACVLNGNPSGDLSVSATVTISDTQSVEVLKDAALIDPLGVVFDSAYDTPVAGAEVIIRNADGSVAINPLTEEAYEPQITGEDGRYQFPYLYPNQSYYIDVTPPDQYTFPSAMAAEVFPTREVNQYSYGENGYNQVAGSGVFFLTSLLIADIPLDPELDTDLTINKTASLSEVSVGGSIVYTIEIQNHSDGDISAVKINDELPRGFNLVEGTVTLDGVDLEDYAPEGAPRPNLVFSSLPFIENNPGELGVIRANQAHTLTYRVRTTAGAVGSDGVNTAQSTGRTETSAIVTSNISRATVTIKRDGVLSDKGILFGKVFVDADCNNIHNGGEWPIGGVKLYMQDGTWAITDSNGQYSIYGLSPGNHVVKLDPITLPEGLIFKPTDNRQMADPNSRLVDLKGGEFHRADFAAICPKDRSEEIYTEIKARNQGQTDWMLENAQKYDPDQVVTTDDSQRAADANGDISSGVDSRQTGLLNRAISVSKTKKTLTTGYSVQMSQFREKALAQQALSELPVDIQKASFVHEAGDFFTVRYGFSLYKQEMQALNKTLDLGSKSRVVPTIYEQMSDEVADKLETPRGLETMILAKDAIKDVNNKQAKEGVWLWPKTDVSFDGRFMVTVRKGLTPTLLVNGKPVPKSQLGEQLENRREKAQVAAWYGVQLEPGKNELEVTAKDMFGNKRVLAKGTFTRPVSAEKLVIESKVKRLPADGGRSYLPVTIKLLDENGYLARGVNFVTVEASDGEWVERDVQDQVQGRQIRVINGLRVVHLKSSERSGDVRIRVTDGSMRDEMEITQIAPLRPLIAVGLVEIGASRFNRDINSPDLLDERDVNGRVAAFMKGRVRGDMHLTLSVDTDKEDDAELFRDINPNESYPIHGDSSQRGYEAQSRSKVYAKLEKDDDSIMWGDFVTDNSTINEDVTRVQRTLTGANLVGRNDKNEWQFFISEQDEQHVVEQIRGKGVALNYKLSQAPLVMNSETIEIITVSRDNPGVVLSTETLSRFGDYTLDDITGELSFSETVAISDEDQNPIYIRASYDLDEGGEEYVVAGARFKHHINEDFSVGLSYTTDQDNEDGFDIYGAMIDFEDKNGLTIRGSIAQMKHADEFLEKGVAGRLYLEKDWSKDSQTSITLGRASEGFTNSAAGISENREELRLLHKQNVYENLSAEIEAIHSRNLDTNAKEQSIGVTADVKVNDWTLTGGVRHIEQKSSTEDESFQTFVIGAKHALNIMGRKGTLGAEYEQDFDDTDRRRIAITGDIQIHDHVKLYATGERINSLTGVSGLSSTTNTQDSLSIGVKSDIMKSTELYSEYRVRGAIDDRDLETATGLRGSYEITKGLSVSPHIEYVKNMDGDEGDSVAASIAVKDTRFNDQVAGIRLETRHDDDREYYGLQANYAKRLDANWSVLFKDTLRYESPEDEEDLVDNTLTLGLAYRPRRENKLHSLYYYQNIEERGGDNGDCSTHILSTHQNYALKDDVLLSGRLGGKQEDCDGEVSEAAVLDGRLTWDITNRFDIDIHGGVLATDGADEAQYSFGAGINYLVKENLKFGLGYNVVGFRDEDLDPENYNDEGLYIGLQYKFDENSLNWLTGEK